MTEYILAIDQGTTSSRALLFDRDGALHGVRHEPVENAYPNSGWVEQDPESIWKSVLHVCRVVIADSGIDLADVKAIGLTNQRETTLLWDRKTGEAVYPAIVWQDRRTAAACRRLREAGHGLEVTQRTGLLLDPYFSATKLAWILDSPGVRERAERGELAFGTVDTYLIWRFCGAHVTDVTNASRTLLCNIHSRDWDDHLLDLFKIPRAILPEIKDCAADFGTAKLLGREIPILGVAGDQQAALIGQGCFEKGMAKSTYGTGCFLVVNTGGEVLQSKHRLLATIGYQIDGKPTYALEGSIFIAGAAVQWLRDKLGLIPDAASSEALAKTVEENGGVYLVPAFAGLGAPYWDPDARGALIGLTQDSGRGHIARATLESVSYQTRDLIEAINEDGVPLAELRVDGGMVANNWLMQHLADTLGRPIARPSLTETTALGAATLAALQLGWLPDLETAGKRWRQDGRWTPEMDAARRARDYDGWRQAVARVRGNLLD